MWRRHEERRKALLKKTMRFLTAFGMTAVLFKTFTNQIFLI